ncbi:MAG TPA: CbiX/SirB N-terminal domain-containing protein [Opitutaceae bacterium]|nr:CbiX/SirB N-terminal domain-containing protein [Opitutaceae bacterium]
MKIALIDNGSLEPAAHAGLRAAAAAVGARAQATVEAVSWKHSDHIPSYALPGGPALALFPWVRDQVAAGEDEFVFIPFFISPQGAIGSSLRRDIDALQAEARGFDYLFADGLTADVLAAIAADRIREASAAAGLRRPPVVLVDHGGPSPASAAVRNEVADGVRAMLGGAVSRLSAASMESPDGPEFEFNRPLLTEALLSPGFDSGDVLISPLFLSPGRHAGPGGDLAHIARSAEARAPGLRCHFTGLVGTHPLAIDCLASSLSRALHVGAHP